MIDAWTCYPFFATILMNLQWKLYVFFIQAPDFFYKCLEEKLGLKSLEDLMKFDKALEKLSRDHPEINKLL